ncbi:MAG: high-potential iron-sulfur protein [Bdellovibrionales bacterium]|nr:high-potential iron-sulfur protein [Bdellovibrionales bacterium]
MNNTSGNSRRKFLKSLAVLGAVPAAAAASRGLVQPALAQSVAPIDENAGNAQALGYRHDASQVDTAKFPRRATEEGKKQFCSGCQLFLQGGISIDGKEGKWGKCALFPTGLVNENGWCNSWVPKQG